MQGSYAVIGKDNGAGSLTAAEHSITGYSFGSIARQAQQNLESASVTQAGGKTVLSFSRKLDTGDAADRVIDPAGASTLVWACGAANSLAQHKAQGSIRLVWASGSATASKPLSATVVALHGLLLILAWALCIPSSVVVAVLFKHHKPAPWWFKMHRLGNSVGLSLATAGVIAMAAGLSSAGLPHLSKTHTKVGLAVLVLGLLQPLSAFLRPHPTPPGQPRTTARFAFELYHKGVGRILLALSVLAMASGIALVDASGGLASALKGAWVVCAMAVLALVAYGKDWVPGFSPARERETAPHGEGVELSQQKESKTSLPNPVATA
jgi:hypothetical protein